MFNLGSDDKKELQENMKEIKSLIDGKEGQQEPEGGLDFGNEQESGSQSSPNLSNQDQGAPNQQNPQNNTGGNTDNLNKNGMGNGRGNTQMNQQSNQSSQQAAKSNQRSNSFTEESTVNQNNLRNQQNDADRGKENENVLSEREVRNQRQNQNSNSSKDESSDGKKISSNEPLFLREEQFTDIREMVEEMSYLTQEMGQKVDRMKKTVRNERDISKDSDELVEAFTQRRSKVESTIKSGQN